MTQIVDGEVLYRYANPAAFPPGQTEIPMSIFNDPEMSCDWEKLQAAPEVSLHVKLGKSVIVEIKICDAIRNPVNPKRTNQAVADWKQEIVHDPLAADPTDQFTPNDAHALIKGRKKAAVLDALRENSKFRSAT
ncbi:hypothetical protein [Janthinobacterium lividum]|uniref:hypothetical protein n=1 Tax=Janthinobacterium lividum TaxID=29581 RepID=UPI001267EC7A|nr:hypothetical protein [Janthinobacterium lividum]